MNISHGNVIQATAPAGRLREAPAMDAHPDGATSLGTRAADGPWTRRDHQRVIEGLLEMGVAYVVVVSSERRGECPACARMSGRLLPIDPAPELPVAGCAVVCACRLAPLSLE